MYQEGFACVHEFIYKFILGMYDFIYEFIREKNVMN